MGKKRAAATASLAKQSRNAEIDFYRLVMTIVVIFHHSRYLTDPAWMEAPFILSGYFAVRTVMRSPEASYEDIPRWMWRKFAPILKMAVAVGVVHRVIYSVMMKMTLVVSVKELIRSLYDLFLVQMAGFINGQSFQYIQWNIYWYLSALFIVLPVFYAALIKNRKLMFGLIAPLSPVLIYGYQASKSIPLAGGTLIRAWGGVCLGAVTYVLTEKIKKTQFTKTGRSILSLAELAALACALLYMFFYGWDQLDYIAVTLFLAVIVIAMSEKASISGAFPVGVTGIQDFVLALYLGQGTVGPLFIPWLRARVPGLEKMGAQLWLYVALCLLYALVWTALMRLWDRAAPGRKLMKKLVST